MGDGAADCHEYVIRGTACANSGRRIMSVRGGTKWLGDTARLRDAAGRTAGQRVNETAVPNVRMRGRRKKRRTVIDAAVKVPTAAFDAHSKSSLGLALS